MARENIILGEGIFGIGETDVGLTRGGGAWNVEREYREVNADGDRGPVKGRMRLVRSVATLTLNQLEIKPAELAKMVPATKVTTENGTTTWTGKPDIEDEDYNELVTWTGRTMSGKAVIITVENAINLDNIAWTMNEQDEVVQQIVFTGTYEEEDRLGANEPWKVQWVDEA